MCPCHGSQVSILKLNTFLLFILRFIVSQQFYPFPLLQYAPTGAVVRGPAPLPLALAHCDVAADGKIMFSPWTETDFRTDGKPWWN